MVEAQEKVQKLISDLSSPYFLHSADHPRTPLVDVVLTHTNYGSWSRSIEMALCAKNKLGFIDNTIPCPADPDIQPLWKRVSTMVLSWLLNSISNTITPTLASCRTPYELWRDLESRFTQGNNATIFKIQKEISNLEQNNLDITNYYNTFKTLWDQLDGITPLPACTCTNYSAMMSQRFKPQPSRSNSNNNQRRNSHDQQPYQQNQAKTFNSPQPQHPPYASPLNRQQQSTRQSPVAHPNQPRGDSRGGSYPPRGDVQQEPHNRGSKDPNAYCTHCNQTGHYQSGCFKLIGYPDWFFNRPSRAPSNQSNYAAQSSVMDSNPHLSPTEASQASAFYEHPSAFFSAEPLTYPDPPQPTNPPTSNTTTSSSPPSPAPSPDLPPQPIHSSAHPTNSISSDNNTNSLDPSSSTVPSRPSRVHRPPGYLRDYLCPTLPSATTASTHASPQSSAKWELPLIWDFNLENYANWWAGQRQSDCALVHSFPEFEFKLGENIFWGSGSSWTPADAVRAWADEEKYYTYSTNTCAIGEVCGHYTQIVWKNTRRVGCARVVCDSGDVFMTCNYDPPGNYVGERPY
ncbi:hypothetical protein Vadar_003069 [Vaccinium darrowii]|uniref:Uncharacterized protein n=1 Tax=Vaccinium darrowii TaxID=229202 RepID=A0ACB7Z191_9ERIC|nr:hypothetical protein Vadar_003069 [Vaccinium darrowii]